MAWMGREGCDGMVECCTWLDGVMVCNKWQLHMACVQSRFFFTQVVTLEGWTDIMYHFEEAENKHISRVFFITVVLVHAHIHAYIHAYIHACTLAHTHARTHAHTHTHVHTHAARG